MSLALPWMLLGLLGLPTLAAIYWLRSRAKPRTVSSLFLWVDQRRPRQGGRIFQRLQTPLTFFLELLAIASIVLAAAGPSFTRSRYARPLVVVLDDSYSMLAGTDASSRQRATQALLAEFQQTDYVARVVIAGVQPRLLGSTIRSAEQLRAVLDQWSCAAPAAGIEAALALAGEIGGATSRILVVSDQPPQEDLPSGKVEWWSYGQPLANVAITAAARDRPVGADLALGDRVLLEVTNFGTARTRTELAVVETGREARNTETLELEPGAVRRILLNLAAGSGELRATLTADGLEIDNRVVLVSPRRPLLRVQLRLNDAGSGPTGLRSSLTRAFEATGQGVLVDDRADLVVVDHDALESSDAWRLQILRGADPISYDGPFVLDRSHPLADGLSLDAVIWSVPRAAEPAGTPVLTAGNRVLLADSEDARGRHRLQLALDPELSNLLDSPDWPILMANLVRWQLSLSPGPAEANVRLGQSVRITLDDDAAQAGKAVVKQPDGVEQSIAVHGKQVEVHADQTGLYQFQAGTMHAQFASNALNGEESNLARCSTGRWGNWNESDVFQDQRIGLDWVFILLGLGCLTAQMVVVARAGASPS